MLHSDITFLLALIALVAGSFLVLTAKLHTDKNFAPCKVIGYCVAILAVIILIFTVYPTIRSISCGYTKQPWKYRQQMMLKNDPNYMMQQKHGPMMQNGQQMPMMQNRQGGMMQSGQGGMMMQNDQQMPMQNNNKNQ
jgi:hypothetical protein